MNYALILAGGTGSRAGGALPKQFQMVRGKRMLWWSVEAFKDFDSSCRIVVAVNKDFIGRWEEMFGEEERALGVKLTLVEGGESRFQSVKNALRAVENGPNKVFIHDGARPLVTPELIERGEKVISRGIGAVPVVPITDSIRQIKSCGTIAVDRKNFVAVQTPQVFYADDIKSAYEASEDGSFFTDDASVAEHYGMEIITFPGDSKNIKITNPEDFRLI